MKFKVRAQTMLDGLAERFEDRKLPTNDGFGWGQFIDGSTSNTQVGPYGTSAGIIVKVIARGLDITVDGAAADLANRWALFLQGDPEQKKLFCQNPRLAWVYLALSLSGTNFRDVADAIRRELLQRQSSDGRWGDWWVSPTEHDTTARRFSTAFVHFCLSYQAGASQEAKQWANNQPVLPLSSYGLPTVDVIFHALAVLTIADNEKTLQAFRRELKARAWRQLVESRELGVYFYDFRFANGANAIDHGREYFIVPIRLIGVMLGSMAVAPPLLKAAALSAASSVMESVRAQQGVYKEAEGSRASSLNQAWAAISVGAASCLLAPRSGKVLWWLVRERQSIFLDRYFPFIAVALATALAATASDKILLKGVAAFCLLTLGWLYSGKINRLLQRA